MNANTHPKTMTAIIIVSTIMFRFSFAALL